MSCAIAIFVKTPALSPVKTRLWPQLGRGKSERLHLASAAAVRSMVEKSSHAGTTTGYWAIAEAAELSASHWPGLHHVEQGMGSLGERMACVYRQLRTHHRGVILIGADAPQLQSHHLVQMAEWLDSTAPRLGIGRAEDGGFWLFGGNQDLVESAWTRAHYSRATTSVEFIEAMSGYGDWLELDILRDIDEASDIEPVQVALASLDAPSAEQRQLCVVLGELNSAREECL
ncbi:MAG TPA: DUF2064 domain-containing protein [Dokdonella sp.]|uniref:TIGR04282 family arsenosugar biosynthesis glycosyltransferase n=1 Tax=Dokdonella sp. TaxID=2291710 RepID=UPI002D80A8A2|nr:DUF2064 domain-containing protein [Dokdonella sp.]HET9031739.1 DUF2064 domain-containing protein [Dokdonella sp.]